MKTKKIATFGAVAALSCGLVGGFATVPAAFADSLPGNSVPSSTSTSSEDSHSPKNSLDFPQWTKGEDLTFHASGYKTENGQAGSQLVLKDDEGSIMGTYDANAQGEVTGTIKWNESYRGRDQVEITVLTGKMAGDVKRSDKETVQLVSPPSSLPGGQGGMGAVGDNGGQKNDEGNGSTPAATAEATTPAATPSASATAEATESATATATATENAEVTNGTSTSTQQFANCTEAHAAGMQDIKRGDAAYAEDLDSDRDGVACESNGGNGEQGTSSENSNAMVASSENNGSNDASSNSGGRLANTGANGAMTAAGLGLVAVGVGGATVVALRRRKRS